MERHVQNMGILPIENRGVPITVVGAGAIGSFTTLALAKTGFNRIDVYDFDSVELHNVDNQLYGECHIGDPKTSALYRIVKDLTGVELTCYTQRYDTATRPGGIIIFALDSIDTRKEIWNIIKYNPFKALIDGRMGAEVLSIYTVNPGDFTDHTWYEETIFPKEEALPVKCTEKSIMYTPFIIGGFIADQVKKLVNGQPYEKRLTYACPTNQLLLI